MYNGIGLQTARGSGTNGYVQRNLSFVKQTKNKIEYKTEDDFKRLEAELNRTPNQEILNHQKKRQIELKCIQMQEKMEEQGYSEEEVLKKVNEYRVVLTEQMDSSINTNNKKKNWFSDDSHDVKETHRMAELNHDKNDKLKNALGISPYFIEGSSLDATRKAKEALAAEALLQQKKYQLVKDPSPEPQLKDEKNEIKIKEKHKKKEKSRKEKLSKKSRSRKQSSESESDSDSDSSGSDSKKRKKSKSYDRRIKDKKRQKRREHKSRKHAKYSESSSGSDSETTSGSSSESGSESGSSNSSSNSSNYKSKSSRKDSRKVDHKYSSSPEITRKLKSHYDYKGSAFEKDDYQKTSSLIEKNIREVRKENQNSIIDEKQKVVPNNERKQIRDSDNQKRKSVSRSRSSSNSSVPDSGVKRLKSAVYESDGSKRAKEIPKSYSSHYYQTRSEDRSNRSLSPNDKSRHSSRSRQRSRSKSLKSNGSRSSDRSSRSSSASDASSRSVSRSSRSRSPSIPRRKGSPSFLDKRRITSARKRPIPYRRSSPTLSSHSTTCSESRSRSRSHSLSNSSISNTSNTHLHI